MSSNLARLLAGPAEPRTFYALCDLIDRLPAAEVEAAMAAAQPVLDGWPLEEKNARPWEVTAPMELPPGWVDALLSGAGDLPRLGLGRALFAVSKPATIAEKIETSVHLRRLAGIRLVSSRTRGSRSFSPPRRTCCGRWCWTTTPFKRSRRSSPGRTREGSRRSRCRAIRSACPGLGPSRGRRC